VAVREVEAASEVEKAAGVHQGERLGPVPLAGQEAGLGSGRARVYAVCPLEMN
jgi:hypothetical protein